ncbi:response regulator transcription factor [Enterococcus sp. ALS3]|uniref:Response regulator transcription factor n=1 Tax=Enterococcus alishanensis TaxID=1303817 RepID=A0ABS6TGZ2_9ENTE|nr:response regulator transcription factor [Enterococcus alishanensis]MBV7392079.1 response regulator transcription factor [Enterococcus alishanensis]
MTKILIIEDDEAIATIEQDFLEINGFETEIVTDGHQGLKKALSNEYDLLLLDVMLPGMDGIKIMKRIRDKVMVPILLVTAKGDELDKLRGLGLGADDYISKPFSPSELVARVKSNLAQAERLKAKGEKSTNKILQFGEIEISPDTMKVTVAGEVAQLKHKEFELLLFLMENPEHVFSKEAIYERIWGMDAFGDIRTVAVHINRLREKIEKNPSEPQHIQTVWGAGYRFMP